MKYFVNFINMQTYHLSFLLFTQNNQYFNPQSYPLIESKTLALFISYPHYPQVLWIKSIPNPKILYRPSKPLFWVIYRLIHIVHRSILSPEHM